MNVALVAKSLISGTVVDYGSEEFNDKVMIGGFLKQSKQNVEALQRIVYRVVISLPQLDQRGCLVSAVEDSI